MYIKKIGIFFLLLFISACNQVRISPLTEIPVSWNLEGKIAVNVENQGGTATFFWKREGDFQTIELSGPLGVGRVLIEQNGTEARLRDNQGNVFISDSIDDLLLGRVYWPVPFEEMTQWVESWRHTPRDEAYFENGHGEDNVAIYQNWQVDVRDIATQDGTAYPRITFFTARPQFLDYVGRFLTDAVSQGDILPPEFNLPPSEIKVKIIFQTIQ